jgi:hypothetical protein
MSCCSRYILVRNFKISDGKNGISYPVVQFAGFPVNLFKKQLANRPTGILDNSKIRSTRELDNLLAV